MVSEPDADTVARNAFCDSCMVSLNNKLVAIHMQQNAYSSVESTRELQTVGTCIHTKEQKLVQRVKIIHGS